jgi:hypothetical protein
LDSEQQWFCTGSLPFTSYDYVFYDFFKVILILLFIVVNLLQSNILSDQLAITPLLECVI